MKRLIEIAKGYPRVFVRFNSPHEKAEFMKQATEEGFMLGDQLPSQCKCDDVMIIHDDYTLNYCVGMSTNLLLHLKRSKVVNYSEL